ncbi:MAG: hypothetical protein NTV95_03560 [Candidatus Saccharibacteria bacterium]|nr:hypothetical protein [Candidatus Saccharibacteria bacterium]
MKLEGYCEDCPIISCFESAISTDNPELTPELIEVQTEEMVRNFGQHLLVLCEAKNGYGIIDIRDDKACKRITNKDGNKV